MLNQMAMPRVNLLKLPDPAAQTTKYANMMNMAKQQEAAERQAAMAQETLDLKKAEGARQAEAQGPAMTKAQQDNAIQALSMFREAVSDIAEGDVAAAEAVRAELIARVPGYDKFVRPATEWNSAYKNQLKLTAEKEIEKTIATPVASLEVDTRGNPRSVTVGGLNPQQSPVYDAPEAPMAAPRTPMPAAPPAAGAPMRATQGSNTTQRDLMQQGMNPRNIPSGSPTSRPISFNQSNMSTPTAGQMSPDMVPAILDSAVKTGVMAQIDLDQMLALAPPQAKEGIINIIRSNNISLQANAPSRAASGMGQQPPMAPNPVQRPQSQFADMRGPAPQPSFADLGGQPPMQNAMLQSQNRTSTPLMQKNPNVSPYPGSAQVPLSRVAAEADVQRESPAQAAAKAAAVAKVNATADFEKKAAEKLPGRNQVSTLIKKVRAAYEQLDKAEAIPSETRGGFANAMDYFGTSSLGREAQKMVGTKPSKYLSEIINSRKLLATAIKNATGMSAQEMNSNVELQLTLDALTDPTQGIEAARTTLDTLEELYGAPRTAATAAAPRAAAKTLVIPDAAKQMLRKNPSPQQRAFFDRTFGKGAAAKVMGNR